MSISGTSPCKKRYSIEKSFDRQKMNHRLIVHPPRIKQIRLARQQHFRTLPIIH
jgi:hypothetical protein